MAVRSGPGAFKFVSIQLDKYYMLEALKEARKAFEEDEVPVGAIIVSQKRIVAKAHNQIERLNDPTAHAEMIAITQAASTLGSKWLNEASIYVTIERAVCAPGHWSWRG